MKKITEDTLIPLSLVAIVCSFAWAWAKLDSKVDQIENKCSQIELIDRRVYRLELGIKKKGDDD